MNKQALILAVLAAAAGVFAPAMGLARQRPAHRQLGDAGHRRSRQHQEPRRIHGADAHEP